MRRRSGFEWARRGFCHGRPCRAAKTTGVLVMGMGCGEGPVWRAAGRRPLIPGRLARSACLATLLTGLIGLLLAQVAAAGPGFSFTASKNEPYAVCGLPTPGHDECLAIIVPAVSVQSLPNAVTTPNLPQLGRPFLGSGVGGGYSPADLRSAYDLPSTTAGSGQTVAIVDAYDDPNAESDLAVYRSRYGLPACTSAGGCFSKVNQTGGSSLPAANASWAVEISLDLDMVSAACPNCHLLLVEASNNASSNLYAAENEAAALGATEISNSWGGEETSGETSLDTYFDHPGIPITFSAGDSGYVIEYPAASPDVIAVGGTKLTTASNARGWTETAWSGSGGGCSAYEPKPAWQTDSGCARRTDNDVAAVASPETPVSVADSYKLPREFSVPEAGWTLVGGTSASSPLIAGTMALANAYTRSLAGADALYREAAQNGTGVLDDVVSGSTGTCGTYLCNAGPGYDGPTGLGSPYGAPVVTTSEPPPQWYANGVLARSSKVATSEWGQMTLHSSSIGEVVCTTFGAGNIWNEGAHGFGEVVGWHATGCEAPEEARTLESENKAQLESGELPCATPGAKVGEGKCITVLVTDELPIEAALRQGEICKVAGLLLSNCPAKSERETVNVASSTGRGALTVPWKVELAAGEREGAGAFLQRTGLHEFGESGTALAQNTACYPKEGGLPARGQAVPAGCVVLTIAFPQIPTEVVFYGSQEVVVVNGVKNGLSPTSLVSLEAGKLFSGAGAFGEAEVTGRAKMVGSESLQLIAAK